MNHLQQLTGQGYCQLNHYFSPAEMAELTGALETAGAFDYARADNRNLVHTSPHVEKLARSGRIARLLPPAAGYRAVKAFVLDKSTATNWIIPWHQDLYIALKRRVETEGYLNWALHGNIPHVEPPVPVLEQLFTIRISLDHNTRRNGAMRIIPGTHRLGRLDAAAIARLAETRQSRYCEVPRGGVLVFSPLLLHDSPRSTLPQPRRVLQLEFAPSGVLAAGLEWH